MNRDRLKQEPSGDLISREETLTAFADYVGSGMSMDDYDALWNIVAKMPPANHQETVTEFADRCRECGKMRKGHWIAYEVRLPDRTILNYRCSVCGRKLIGYTTETLSEAPFCHCGAKMVEPQERSDKE